MLERSYLELLALVGLARLVDLVASRIRVRAEPEANPDNLWPLVACVHVLALGGPVLERRVRQPPWHPLLMTAMLAVLLAATIMRGWYLLAQWRRMRKRGLATDQDPVSPFASMGPDRYLRHPLYVATLLEVIALPLIGSAYLSAVAAGTLYAIVIQRQLLIEERTLGAERAARWLVPDDPRPPSPAPSPSPHFRVIPGGRDGDTPEPNTA
jgi:methyltransferase